MQAPKALLSLAAKQVRAAAASPSAPAAVREKTHIIFISQVQLPVLQSVTQIQVKPWGDSNISKLKTRSLDLRMPIISASSTVDATDLQELQHPQI
jgi:hypothetical protein